MRLIGWIVVVSMGLALLRLATILALVVLGGWLLWALIAHPRNTIAALIFLAAISVAKASPLVAVFVLSAGVGISRIDSCVERGTLEN